MKLYKSREELESIVADLLHDMSLSPELGGFGTQASIYDSIIDQEDGLCYLPVEENDVRIWQCLPQKLKAQLVPDTWNNPLLSPEQVAELEALNK